MSNISTEFYRTSIGDIWQLGRNYLYCGSSEDAKLVKKQVSTHGEAELVFTDPPYRITNMRVSKTSFLAPWNKGGGDVYNTIEEANLVDFDPKNFLSILPEYFGKNKLNAYIFHNKDLTPDYMNWVYNMRKSPGYKKMSSTMLVWQKKAPLPLGASHYADVEYLLYIRCNGKWNDMSKAPLADRKRVLPHDKVRGDHPTMKPVELIANQIRLTTDVDDLVYDPYIGSGSTILACEDTGRRCIATEIMPKYCDIALSRWEGATGRIAWRVHSDYEEQ